MLRGSARRVVCLAAGLLLAGTAAGEVGVQQPQDPRIEAAAARVRTLQDELQRLSGERESVVRAFEAADVELALRREQLEVLAGREELLAADIRRQEARVGELETTLTDARETLRLRAVSLYRIGPLSYNRLLLSADSAQDALVAYQLITFLTARDRDLVRDTRTMLADLATARSELEQTEQQLTGIRTEVAGITERLQEQQQERQEALRRLDREAEDRRLALADAERSARELESTLAELSDVSEAAPAAFAASRGSLPWPVDGTVVGGFGRRRNPVYDTYTVSRGIEIEAAEGDPVHAVHDGKVVFADWYSGYGLLVILDHGDGYFSLYGHLSQVEVGVNDRVTGGQELARAGETASLTGPNLYFEIRQGTDALDPLSWLTPRR